MDVKDNYDSQSYDTPWKNNWCYSSAGDTITTTKIPQYSTLLPPGKEYLRFQIE